MRLDTAKKIGLSTPMAKKFVNWTDKTGKGRSRDRAAIKKGTTRHVDDALERLRENPLASIDVGNIRIGFVDEVNGPGSTTAHMPLSRFEALVLVRYWVQQHIDSEQQLRLQYSSDASRIRAYAGRRIGELRAHFRTMTHAV